MCELLATLLAQVAALAIEHKASRCARRVTISVGAITIVPTREESGAAALATADSLLYEAKEKGRNRAVHVDAQSGDRTELEGELSPPAAEGGSA
jgi:PleD family two-component response regulator